MEEAIDRAISLVGGPAEMARKCDVSIQAVTQWGVCPHHRVLQIERLTHRKVTRHELRPDLYPLEVETE